MDLEHELFNAVGKLINPQMIFLMLQFLVVLWAAAAIKNWIGSQIAWWDFRTSLDISLGTHVGVSTSTGRIDGRIVSANRSRIIIETDDLRVYIPTKTFPDRDWILLKKNMLVKDAKLKASENEENDEQ